MYILILQHQIPTCSITKYIQSTFKVLIYISFCKSTALFFADLPQHPVVWKSQIVWDTYQSKLKSLPSHK